MNWMQPYLYHGIRDYDLNRLINILKTGYILPRKMLPDRFKVERKPQFDFNCQSWISLSQKSLYDDYYGDSNPSAFDNFIYNHLCAVIDNDIEGLNIANHIFYDYYGPDALNNLVSDNSNDRYSTYMDEVQTNIPIPIDKFIAIGYPFNYFVNNNRSKEDLRKELGLIKSLLNCKSFEIPIIDSSFYDFADTKEDIEKHKILELK
jgi:hypothetical protein